MGCACGSRVNIEENIRDYINDLVISKTSINEYKKNLSLAIKKKKFDNKRLFEMEFLDPLFDSRTDNFKEIKRHVTDYFYKIKNENPVFFLVSLSFLCDSMNYSAVKSNYESILYDTLPDELTRVIKKKNHLRVFKKLVKFYVRLVSQFIIFATEGYFSKTTDEKNALNDLKIIYGNIYVKEYVNKLFNYETENNFNLEKFLKVHYEDLKHTQIRSRLFEIYTTSGHLDYSHDREKVDETDEFSEPEESVEEKETEQEELVSASARLKNAQLKEEISVSVNDNMETNLKVEPEKLELVKAGNIHAGENIEISGDNYNPFNNQNNFVFQKNGHNPRNEESNIGLDKLDLGSFQENSREENEIKEDKNSNSLRKAIQGDEIERMINNINPQPKYDNKTINSSANRINKTAKGYLYRKAYLKLKPELENQQNRIQEYIISNFTCEKIKKAENLRRQEFDIKGWTKFYHEDTNLYNIDYGDVYETKFTIFNGEEYYSGLLNSKGEKHSFGISIKRQGNKYQGFWYENLYHGWGEKIDKNGTIFQGQFIHGDFTGKGEKFGLDNSYYIGDFENGMKEGDGQEDSEFYNYTGNFKKNKKHGKGKIYMKVLKDTYEGDFKDDHITGNGEYHWSNKNQYVGEFLNGKMHGKGINTWPDGTCYEGDYINGIKDGFGKYTKPGGKIYEGSFKEGKPHGKGKLINETGIFEVEYNKGILVKTTPYLENKEL